MSSGWFWTASLKEQKIIPTSFSCSLNVVPIDSESNIASTAILDLPDKISLSVRGTPSFSK